MSSEDSWATPAGAGFSGARTLANEQQHAAQRQMQGGPLRPEPPKSGSRRPPSSCRFVEQTLRRLGEDNARALARPSSVLSDCSTIVDGSWPLGGASRYDMHDSRTTTPGPVDYQDGSLSVPLRADSVLSKAEFESERQSLLHDASDALNAVKSIADIATTSCLPSQLEGWQKFGQQAQVQMQKHLDELAALHESFRKFEIDYLSQDPFAKFSTSIEELKLSVQEMEHTRLNTKQMLNDVADLAAERVSAKLMHELRSTVLSVEDTRKGEIDNRKARDAEMWERVEARLEMIPDLCRTAELLPQRREFEDRFDHLPVAVCKGLRPLLEETGRDVSGSAQLATRHIAESLHDILESIKAKTRESIDHFAEDILKKLQPGAPLLLGVEAELRRMCDQIQRDEAHQVEADALRSELQRLQGELDTWTSQAKSSGHEATRLRSDLDEVKTESTSLQATLRASQIAPVAKALRSLKEVETRGNLRVNIARGEVDLVRGIIFSTAKPSGPPTAEFKNPEVVELLLEDLARVAVLVGVPMVLECFAGAQRGSKDAGTPAFWQALAQARAELVGSGLKQRGVPSTQLIVSGVLRKEQKADGLSIRFEAAELFTVIEKTSKKAAGKPASPRKT
eukprot:TRINITY_DN41821_c0_g1_i1.p1 TRINITY_DN41821_c0_g1~~TRINITY_DN41821_c0_g1_i1.p1  ORF type:complete len:624 (-),score=113.70 TRINITY_DN41821_c0_g1_i1:266-2137(-)